MFSSKLLFALCVKHKSFTINFTKLQFINACLQHLWQFVLLFSHAMLCNVNYVWIFHFIAYCSPVINIATFRGKFFLFRDFIFKCRLVFLFNWHTLKKINTNANGKMLEIIRSLINKTKHATFTTTKNFFRSPVLYWLLSYRNAKKWDPGSWGTFFKITKLSNI